MKKFVLLILFLSQISFSQNKNKEELKKVINTFMESIIKSNSITYQDLFLEKHVNWLGIYRDRTQQKILEKDPKNEAYFVDNYKDFFKSVKGGNCEEKFYNVEIIEDGNLASINFDYTFWFKKKMLNWGKESWQLIKVNGKWKITSVIFSMDLTEYFPQPSFKDKKIK